MAALPPGQFTLQQFIGFLDIFEVPFLEPSFFSVIVFFRVACNYWCRLGLQIGAQLQASLFFGETLHYLILDEIKAIDSCSFHCRSGVPCHGTLLDRLYGSVGDFLIAGFIFKTPNSSCVKSGLSCKSFICYYVRRKLLDDTIISLPYFFPSTSAMTNAPPSWIGVTKLPEKGKVRCTLNWNRQIAFCQMDSLERFPDKVQYNI